MQKVLTAAEMREVDRLTTEKYGIPSLLLMENAAHAVARVITEKLGGSVEGKSILILCGPGNNGGDGAALARILWTQGADVDVYLFGKVDETRGDAKTNFEAIKKISDRDPQFSPYLFLNEVSAIDPQKKPRFLKAHAVIDAVFGTGLTRPISPELTEFFKFLFVQEKFGERRPVLLSIDVPSGLNADSAVESPGAFRADTTVTFTAPKPANILAPACQFNGELLVEQIGSPYEVIDESESALLLSDQNDASDWLRSTRFSDDSYKNKRGHALIIAGSERYSGAAVLAGDAAMRSGIGLVTIATPKSSKESIAARVLPEVMIRGVAETDGGAVAEEALDELNDLLEKADAVAVGSGLSQDESTKRFVRRLVGERTQPMVVDADAVNLLSPLKENHPDAGASPLLRKEGRLLPSLILTPHEGEFMRLLGTEDKDVLKDRVAVVREFAEKHGVILVLKGERVLIGEPGGKVVVNPTGNSGLGKAGNGDTLTGILAGFIAQAVKMNIDIFETVIAAVYIAGMAGDVAEKKFGKRVMTASDVRECLVEVFASLSEK